MVRGKMAGKPASTCHIVKRWKNIGTRNQLATHHIFDSTSAMHASSGICLEKSQATVQAEDHKPTVPDLHAAPATYDCSFEHRSDDAVCYPNPVYDLRYPSPQTRSASFPYRTIPYGSKPREKRTYHADSFSLAHAVCWLPSPPSQGAGEKEAQTMLSHPAVCRLTAAKAASRDFAGCAER
jgi:hypothetical protein